MAQNTLININNTWVSCYVWININGIWKKCIPWVNIDNNIWKKCGQDNTYTMTVYIPSSGDNTSQSQSRTVSIPDLQSVVSCVVNTGSVSYSINGTDVTINVNDGSPVRSYKPSKTATDIRQTSPGGSPATLPSSIQYNSDGYTGTLNGGTAYVVSGLPADSKIGRATLGTTYPGAPASNLPDVYNYNYDGYSGQIPAIASAYVYSGSPEGSKYCTKSIVVYFVITNGEIISGNIPSTVSYNDGDYSGELDFIEVNSAYTSAYEAMMDAYLNNGSWSGNIMFDYGATLTKSDTRIWRRDYEGTVYRPDTQVWQKDYSGTVYGAIIYYYSYVATLNYTIN